MIRTLVWLDLRRLLRDRAGWLLSLVMPLLLAIIMGMAFGGGGRSGISAIPLVVAGDLPPAVRDGLARALEQTGLFEVSWCDTAEAARRVRRGRVPAAVVLPDSLPQRLFSDRPVTFLLWEDVNSRVKAGIVEQMLRRGIDWWNLGETVYRSVWDDPPLSPDDPLGRLLSDRSILSAARLLLADDPDATAARRRADALLRRQELLADAFTHAPAPLRVEDRRRRPGDGGEKPVNLYDFFLPSMAIFFLMFAVAARLGTLHRERDEGTLRRLLVTPLEPRRLVAGKWCGAVAVSLVQLGLLLGLGKLLLGVHLGNDPWSLPVAALAVAAALASLFLLLALVTRSEAQMGQLATVVTLVGAMTGGVFLPVEQMPAFLRAAGKLLPTRWCADAFRGIVLDHGSLADVSGSLLGLLVWAVAAWTLVLVIVRRRERRGGWL